MKIKRHIPPLIVLLFCVFSVQTQVIEVVGKVTTFKTIAVDKARITVNKTEISTLSDSLGHFSIICNNKDKLIIGASGFKRKKIKVNSLTDTLKINLIFDGGEKNIEEAVSSEHVRKSDLIDAIKYRSIENSDIVYTDILNMINHKLPRVSIGELGIYIRGGNEYTGRGEALILIDGVTSSFNSLKNLSIYDVEKLESVEGADAVIYGGEAAYGAILVTTKGH